MEDLDSIINDSKTVRLGLKQNRYTALTSMNVDTIVVYFCGRSFGEIPIVL